MLTSHNTWLPHHHQQIIQVHLDALFDGDVLILFAAFYLPDDFQILRNAVLQKLLAPTYEAFLQEHLGKENYEELQTEAETKKLKQIPLPDDLQYTTFAYLLTCDLRADALVGTRLARASVGQIRLHLFKIAVQLTVSVRRVYFRLCTACPLADVFAEAHRRLCQPAPG